MNNKLELKYFIANTDIKDKVIFSLSIIILTCLNMKDFLSSSTLNANAYDFLLYIINNRFFSIYVIPPIVLLFLYKININFNKYIFIRFNNKSEWFLNSIISISKLILIFVFFLLIIIFGICTIKGLSLFPNWSLYALDKFSGVSQILKYNPLILSIIQIFSFYCYLFVLSLIFLILNIKFENNIGAFLCVIIINSINIGILLSKLDFIGKYSLGYNLLLDLHNWGNTPIYPTIRFSMFFWIITILIIYIIGNKLSNKVDLVGKKK